MKTRTIRRVSGRGFTLLEMMLVVMIIGVLMGIAAWNIIGQGDKAKRAATVASMKQVEAMMQTYYIDYGAYPPTLDALVPKYTPKKPMDAWKRELHYVLGATAAGGHAYQLFSTGASGEVGGQDNIDYWTADEPQPQN